MTAFTSQRNGNWSDTTTSSPWYVSGGTPCPIPGNGDTFIALHSVTVDANTTVGLSAAIGQAGTGTVGTSGSSTTLTGSSTAFTTQLKVGDTLLIGTHVVFVTAIASDTSLTMSDVRSITAGTSFTFTPCAGYVGAGGALTLAASVVFTLRGDINHNRSSGLFTMGAGSKLEFDASASSSPSTNIYRLRLGGANYQDCKLVVNGSSGSRCTLTSNAGGAAGCVDVARNSGSAVAESGFVDASYLDISYIGDSTHNAFTFNVNVSGGIFSLQHCTMDHCGQIVQGGGVNAAMTVRLNDVLFTNSQGTYVGTLAFKAPTTGVMQITLCSFDKSLNIFGPGGLSLSKTVFLAGLSATPDTAPPLFDGVLVYTGQDTINWYGDITNSYLVHSDAANPHGFAMAASANQTYTGIICQSSVSAHSGDWIFPGPSAAFTYTIQDCILLPNKSDGRSSGKLVSCLGFTGTYAGSIVTNHNTVCTTDVATNLETGALEYGEGTGDGKAGMVTSLKSNLAYTPAGKNAGAVLYRLTGGVQDAVSAANADYNGKSGLASSGYSGTGATSGVGYVSQDSTAPCTASAGAHDVTAAPNFVDETRNFETWAQRVHGADGTVAGALAYVALHPETIYDVANPNALIQWVRAGFAPTNPAYHLTAHDGTDIGAVPFVRLGSPIVGSPIVGSTVVGNPLVGRH